MNTKFIGFVKNFSYALSSNLISMIISAIVILIVPKLIGVEEYGYWQLYLFYASYVGFLHFGWNDGIYLRYGGIDYKKLNKELFFSQFWMLVVVQVLIGLILIITSTLLFTDGNKLFIVEMTAICMLIVNVRLMSIYILQATNRIKEYAHITIMEKVLYCILILLFLLGGVRQFQILIIADLLGKLISLGYSVYCIKDIVFNRVNTFYFSIKEAAKNISVGIKLMFSNIASMFIVGVVRFGIERTWDVATFGKVSLTLSISNLMITLINAVGIILFPILRRTNKDNLPSIYSSMRTILMVVLLGILVVYYPLKEILQIWLPQYADSLIYMALLFPMCVYEGKMALLINTYLKTLRKEKLMLTINVVSVLLSIMLTTLMTLVFKNLLLTIMSIVVLLAFRSALAEVFISRILKISVYKDIFLEMLMSTLFILISWFINSWIGVVFYLFVYGVYLLVKRREIIRTFNNVKHLVKR
ncbi:oligosaccharide flippase family protein [Bacillus sp. SCS-153A]|uniref:oligosaccharide flippase family protein n=1 Tax=Rossellomorea sedimentorum TaxID=3115294 RepID=UPI00390642B0